MVGGPVTALEHRLDADNERLQERVAELEKENANLSQAIGFLGYGDRVAEWKGRPPSWAPSPSASEEVWTEKEIVKVKADAKELEAVLGPDPTKVGCPSEPSTGIDIDGDYIAAARARLEQRPADASEVAQARIDEILAAHTPEPTGKRRLGPRSNEARPCDHGVDFVRVYLGTGRTGRVQWCALCGSFDEGEGSWERPRARTDKAPTVDPDALRSAATGVLDCMTVLGDDEYAVPEISIKRLRSALQGTCSDNVLHEDGEPPKGSRLWRCEQELAKSRSALAKLVNFVRADQCSEPCWCCHDYLSVAEAAAREVGLPDGIECSKCDGDGVIGRDLERCRYCTGTGRIPFTPQPAPVARPETARSREELDAEIERLSEKARVIGQQRDARLRRETIEACLEVIQKTYEHETNRGCPPSAIMVNAIKRAVGKMVVPTGSEPR